jgi:hypothetical protein
LFDVHWALSAEGLAACARFTAALLAAAAVAVVFTIAASRTSLARSLILALTFGAGTSLWSTTSQGLLQHGPCTLFIALAALASWPSQLGTRRLLAAGAALGLAVCARPSAVAVAVVLLAGVLVRHRARGLWVVAGGAPFALALGTYNQMLFGAPWTSAQTLIDSELVHAASEGTDLWGTSLLDGVAGLVWSPARGLLVHSPVVLWAGLGLAQAKGEDRGRSVVLACAALAMWGFAFKWFDWWGGWCFAYRPLVDALPLLALCMLPVIERMRARSWMTAAFGLALSVYNA